MTIQLYVKEWRASRALTLEELSKRSGISAPHLSRIERGQSEWSASHLEAFAKAFGVEPQELFKPPA